VNEPGETTNLHNYTGGENRAPALSLLTPQLIGGRSWLW